MKAACGMRCIGRAELSHMFNADFFTVFVRQANFQKGAKMWKFFLVSTAQKKMTACLALTKSVSIIGFDQTLQDQ